MDVCGSFACRKQQRTRLYTKGGLTFRTDSVYCLPFSKKLLPKKFLAYSHRLNPNSSALDWRIKVEGILVEIKKNNLSSSSRQPSVPIHERIDFFGCVLEVYKEEFIDSLFHTALYLLKATKPKVTDLERFETHGETKFSSFLLLTDYRMTCGVDIEDQSSLSLNSGHF